jgi:hypothetical protein
VVNRKLGFHDVFMISLVCNADGDRQMSIEWRGMVFEGLYLGFMPVESGRSLG